jgi:hypothetical protein
LVSRSEEVRKSELTFDSAKTDSTTTVPLPPTEAGSKETIYVKIECVAERGEDREDEEENEDEEEDGDEGDKEGKRAEVKRKHRIWRALGRLSEVKNAHRSIQID